MTESEARQIGNRTCAQTRLETLNPKQQQERSLTASPQTQAGSSRCAPVLPAAAFLGWFVDAGLSGGQVVRAPDRSNRSHLGSRPRALVGRASAGSGAQHPS